MPKQAKCQNTTKESKMKRYELTFKGLTPLIMHKDNLSFGESITEWRAAPENKTKAPKGDDRWPAWTWIGYTYHDGETLGIDSDCVMTMMREGGAKITKAGKETFKKQTQSGIVIDRQQFDLTVGKTDPISVPLAPIEAMIGNNKFIEHIKLADSMGFELFTKRVVVGNAKHVRVRPLFRNWIATGTITVLDEELTGLTQPILQALLNQAGALCGLGDWRPNSKKSGGSFGKFTPYVKEIS
jgi:hypothetical protein